MTLILLILKKKSVEKIIKFLKLIFIRLIEFCCTFIIFLNYFVSNN